VQRWLTFVIVGAGPTGVEMAGQIAELATER
jgi:NADH dehydrogenase